MTSGKVLGYKLLVGNTIALFLFLVAFSGSSIEYGAELPEGLNGSPQYDPGSFEVSGWSPPTTGVQEIDWLLAFYFTFSYAVAVWLITNPFGG